jgi:hypothetical protein
VLAKSKAKIVEERSTSRAPLTDADARRLLGEVDEVWIARGRDSVGMAAGTAKPADLKGPTGGYRAPMVRLGRTLFVGLQEAALRERRAGRG